MVNSICGIKSNDDFDRVQADLVRMFADGKQGEFFDSIVAALNASKGYFDEDKFIPEYKLSIMTINEDKINKFFSSHFEGADTATKLLWFLQLASHFSPILKADIQAFLRRAKW